MIAMFALKILGIIDIITALAIFMNWNLLFLTVPLFLIHLVKGLMSLGADIVGKLYGIVDLVSAIAILFLFDFPVVMESFLIIILLFKGFTSML
jgi:hypothetical protein